MSSTWQTAANRAAAEQQADQWKKSRDTPLSGKEKGDTETDAAVTKGVKDLFKE